MQLDGLLQIFIVIIAADNDGCRKTTFAACRIDKFKATQLWHADVCYQNVNIRVGQNLQRLTTVSRAGGHLKTETIPVYILL